MATVWLAALAVPASAHASFVSASPGPGIGLPQAPGAVVLRFSEPLNYRLSRIEVGDAGGADVTDGPTAPVQGDAKAMRRPLGLLAPGQYTVTWTTVSTLDGHTLHGSYTFGIGTAASGSEDVAASPVASEGWLGLIGRFVALAGLVVWIGSAAVAHVAARHGVPASQLKRVARVAPLLTLFGTAASLVASALVATGSPLAIPGVLSSRSGSLRGVELLAAAAGSIVGGSIRVVAGVLAAVAVVAEAASGHAAATSTPLVATLSFALHLTAVGVWLFALLASALSAHGLLPTLKAFTPYAVAAAAAVAVTGASNAVLEVAEPAQLVSTGYGRAVLAKSALFAVMVALGLLHWRRRRRTTASPRVMRPVRAELAAGLLAVALATVLVGYPNPPREEAATAAEAGGSLASRLASSDAVSVAAPSGEFVVALSILPPRPGRVVLRVDVLGVEAGDGLRRVAVRGASDSGRTFEQTLQPCGFACFEAGSDIPAAGRWRLTVDATSNRGELGMRVRLPLPTPSGEGMLERTLTAMERLRTARMHEQLRAAENADPILSNYVFAAPDRMSFRVVEGSHLIVRGTRAYRKAGPDAAWERREWAGGSFSWPQSYFRDFWARDAEAVRILGEERLHGEPTTVVSFVRPDVQAWFRLWVSQRDGRVRRMRMLAEGHLMTQDYRSFNAPVRIRAPI